MVEFVFSVLAFLTTLWSSGFLVFGRLLKAVHQVESIALNSLLGAGARQPLPHLLAPPFARHFNLGAQALCTLLFLLALRLQLAGESFLPLLIKFECT